MLENYAQKMFNAPIHARQSMSLKIATSENDKKIKTNAFWPNPVAAEWVLVLLFPLIILSNYKKKLLIVGAYGRGFRVNKNDCLSDLMRCL